MRNRTVFIAMLALFWCGSDPLVLLAESLEEIYFKTRNSYIRQFETGTNTIDDDTAIADLEEKLKTIIGTVNIEGFPKQGRLNLRTLQNQYLDFGYADGLRFHSHQESLFITTDKILEKYVAEKSDLPNDLNSLSKKESFYSHVFSVDAYVTYFAEIPVQSINENNVINAFLGITAQDIAFIPDDIYVFVSNENRIFLVQSPAEAETTEIPKCQHELDKYVREGSDVRSKAYHQCYEREAKNQPFFALLKNQAQRIVDRLLVTESDRTVENFDEFLIRFYSDPDFQKSRIVQPLEGKILEWHETEDMEVVTSVWEPGETEIISDYDAIKSEMKNVKHDISKTENSVIEKIYIENSGFFMDREFRLIEGKWFLCKYDISNL